MRHPITNEGLYFCYADGSKAYHYAASISPRGDCMTVVNGYTFFGWYKGGMTHRALMISRKKIGFGGWVTAQMPHKNTLKVENRITTLPAGTNGKRFVWLKVSRP